MTGTAMEPSRTMRVRRIAKDDLLQRVKKSVSDIVSIFADMELDHEHSPPDPAGMAGAFTAMVGFEGAYRGIVWAYCSEKLAMRLTAGMRGVEQDHADDYIPDALGELVNILGGDIKQFLSPRGNDMALSIPSVFQGGTFFCADLMACAEGLSCSFLHGEERLLVGVMVRKGE